MALRGDLASVDLAQVFQMLSLNKKAGLLSIQTHKRRHVLYFDERGVTVYHNVHRLLDRVVAAFLRSGRLTEQTADEVRDHSARVAQPLADALLAGGYVEPAELEEQCRNELEEEIYDLFFVREAKFEFHEKATALDGVEGVIDDRFFFNCDSLVMEAARRIDEWAYISERVPTTSEVLVATAETIDADEYGPLAPAVFALLDGRRNIARIVETSGVSNFQVCKILSQMLDAQVVAPVAPDQLVPLAAECMAEGRLHDAISLYERAIELQVGLPEAHSLCAKAYQAIEEYEHAIFHLASEAEHRLKQGDREGAAQRLFEIRQLVPTDLQSQDRLIELTLGKGGVKIPGFDPLAEGKQLVDLMLEFGDIQRVRMLLERLLQVEPGDPDLKKALVNVHLKAGDQQRIVELYESIADDLVRQQKPIEAVAYLQKILLIDRGRADISERVRKLYEFDERSRRRGRAMNVLAVAFCLLLVLGAAYWFYNERAEEDFERIDVHALLAADDFAGAQAVWEDFIRTHPLSTAVSKAKAELLLIETSRQQFEARRASERALRERELRRLRGLYQQEWKLHREAFSAGNPEESFAALGRVRDLLRQAGAAEDLAWGHEQNVERTWVRLRDFLAEAERLAAEYDRLVAAGDWDAARAAALRLHADYENTAPTRRAGIPVRITTRPSGAALSRDGAPLLAADGSGAVRTPGVVLCPPQAMTVVVERPGFERQTLVIEATKQAAVEIVLEVVPDSRLTFDAPAQTGVGVGEGWLAVGLRGGRLGLARTDGSSRHVRNLPGLRAVDSTPRVQNGCVFFASNENTIECLPVDPAVPVHGWPITLSTASATELCVADGRVAVVDRAGVLHCWEQSTGRRVLAVSLDAAPSGPPTIDRRQVRVGTVDGRVLAFDAADGRPTAALRSPVGIATRVIADGDFLFFGGSDGSVRAIDARDGRMAWTVTTGRTFADGDLVVAEKTVLALASDNRIVALCRKTGQKLGEARLTGDVLSGLRIQGGRVLAQVRRPKTRTAPARDVLIAIDIEPMTIAWEFVDSGLRPGLPGCSEHVLALPSAGGDIVLFR